MGMESRRKSFSFNEILLCSSFSSVLVFLCVGAIRTEIMRKKSFVPYLQTHIVKHDKSSSDALSPVIPTVTAGTKPVGRLLEKSPRPSLASPSAFNRNSFDLLNISFRFDCRRAVGICGRPTQKGKKKVVNNIDKNKSPFLSFISQTNAIFDLSPLLLSK